MSGQLLWHLKFFSICFIGLIVYLLILFHVVKKQKEIKFPERCYLEKFIGKQYYGTKVICIGITLSVISYLIFNSISIIFVTLVIPLGLWFIRHAFYKYKFVFEIYKNFMREPLNSFVPYCSNEDFQKQINLRWNQVSKAWLFQFNHPVVLIFLLLEFMLPAFLFGYFDGGFSLAILLAIEYYFIGMTLWVTSLGVGIIYWLGKYFPIKISKDMKPYNALGNLCLLTALMIAIVPGIGVPSIANIELILTSPPIQYALFWYTVANLVIFFFSMYGVHKGMVQSKRWILEIVSSEYSMRTCDLLKKIGQKWEVMRENEKIDLKNLSIVSQAVKGIYETISNLSEWPLTIPLRLSGILSTIFPALFAILKDLIFRHFGI